TGSLVHQDSTGHSGVIYPGLAQRMSAGTGILHSEKNDSWRLQGEQHSEPVHFVQMWVVPDERGITPGYEQLEIDHDLLSGGLITVASGMGRHDGAAAIRIKNRYAALHAARLQAGQSVQLPEAPFLHLFVPRGTVTLEGAGTLHPGDAVRFTATGGQRGPAAQPPEILVWEMHTTLDASPGGRAPRLRPARRHRTVIDHVLGVGIPARSRGGRAWARSLPPTARRSSTRTGAAVSPSCSAMAGRCRPMTGTRRCCFSSGTGTGSSPTTGAATGARPRRARATTWTTTPMTWRR